MTAFIPYKLGKIEVPLLSRRHLIIASLGCRREISEYHISTFVSSDFHFLVA